MKKQQAISTLRRIYATEDLNSLEADVTEDLGRINVYFQSLSVASLEEEPIYGVGPQQLLLCIHPIIAKNGHLIFDLFKIS
jgi:hypothetical protein